MENSKFLEASGFSEDSDYLEDSDVLLTTAREDFGITYLFPYQRLVIHNILEAAGVPGFALSEGEDSKPHQIIILPTGAGKSLCFMLPARLLEGLTLVIFPLLSLMADQARRVEEAGMKAVLLRGGQSPRERQNIWRSIDEGRTQIILSNPETLLTDSVLSRLKKTNIAHLVVDEMHTVSEWGDSFRPVYLELGRLISELGVSIVSAFTATASKIILRRIKEIIFPESSPHLIAANPDRPNISYFVHPVLSKNNALYQLLLPRDGGKVPEQLYPLPPVPRPAIVFCRSRVTTELTAACLRRRLGEADIFFYHAGLEKGEKQKVEEWFFRSEKGILCATCAYGMGVDKKNIRTVIHRDVPPSVEAYLQESGRGGRDREASEAHVLISVEDAPEMLRFSDTANRKRYEQLYRVFTSTTRCRREALLEILQAEPEVCFGCDVCRGAAGKPEPGGSEILNTIYRNKRRFTPRQITHILKGWVPSDMVSHSPQLIPQFAKLLSWSHEEIHEALSALLKKGVITRRKRNPWKYTLTVGQRNVVGSQKGGVGRCWRKVENAREKQKANDR